MPIKTYQRSLESVVSGIYEAALDPDLWKEVIADIASYGRSSFAILVWRERGRKAGGPSIQAATDHLELISEYLSGPVVEYNDPILQIGSYPVDIPQLNRDWEPHDLFRKSEKYRRYFRDWNVEDRASVLAVQGADNNIATLTLCRGRMEDLFDRRSVRPLRDLSPHVRRAIQITTRFRRSATQRQSLVAALEQVEDGVFFLDGAQRIVYANAPADRLVSKGILTIRHGRLRTALVPETTVLDTLLQRVIRTGEGSKADPGGSMTLHAADGKISATLSASPMVTFHIGEHFGPQPVRAAVYVREKHASATSAPDFLRERFGFTPAETRVATELQQGYRLQEIADRHGLGKETVRSQLNAIFDKTGARRQSELIKVLLTTPSAATQGILTPRI